MGSNTAVSSSSFYRTKTCVVSGANRGIGLSLTRLLLEHGAQVHAGCRQPESADALQALQKQHPDALHVGALDISRPDAVQAFAKTLPERIDVVFNNAGINVDNTDAAHTSYEQMMDSFRTNTVGPMLMMQALGGKVRLTKGRIANISSVMGSIEQNGIGGNTAYRVSKAALNMLNKNFALQDEQVIYLTMHPGWVKTDMGGRNAQIDTTQSAQGLLQTVAQATPKDSGHFLRYDAERLPW